MKSTQDLCMFLNQLANALVEQGHGDRVPYLGIEIFTDKTFRITQHEGLEPLTLYQSDTQDPEMDINDLCYEYPQALAAEIIDNLSVANVKVSEL